MKENHRDQIPVNSQMLSIQKLLAPVFIGPEAKIIGKTGKKSAFAAAERRKLSLRPVKSQTGHFYPSKVPLSQ